jgi:hypothetical protein
LLDPIANIELGVLFLSPNEQEFPMAEVSLADRLDAEFAAAKKRSATIANQGNSYSEGRWKRLEQVDQTLTDIRDLWRDRLDQLQEWFKDRIKLQTQIAVGNRLATFLVKSPKAEIVLRFAALTDDDVQHVIFQYDLDIVPADFDYDSHSELTFPIDNINKHQLVDWIYDRVLAFGKTYIAMHE